MKVFQEKSGQLKNLEAKNIHDKNFGDEKSIQTLIENNIEVVFDGLEFLSTEFQIKDLRPDSVAFDKEKHSFVIIEYKNVKNKQVLDQGATYYRLLKEHKGDFVLLYNRLKNQQHEIDYFNWDEPYVIFLSPEFTKYQIGATGIGLPVKLYQIRQFDEGIIITERMGETATEHTQFNNSENIVKTKSYVKLDEYDEEQYLSGQYKTGNSSQETRELYFKIKKRLLETFEDIEFRQKKAYAGFYSTYNDACICTLDVGKSKVKITYAITTAKKILSASDFIRDVENIGVYGVGHYQSEIKNEEDIERSLQFVQKVYDYKIKN